MSKLGLKNMPDKRRKLLIWDSEGEPPAGDWTVALWNSFTENDDSLAISMPKLVEEKAEAFRARYLTWIYELGETRINGKRLVDHLELRPGFSYWWMTLLARKFNTSGTSQIDNAIKAFALEGLVSEHKIISIDLVSGNRKLALTLRNFCKISNLPFKWNMPVAVKKPKLTMRLLYTLLPAPIQALIYYLWCLFTSLPLIYVKQPSLQSLNGGIAFVDVLIHLDRQAFKTGKFISNYWTSLVEMLVRSNVKTIWLHNYFYHESIPSIVKSRELINCFNKHYCGIQSHSLAEANLSPSVFAKSLRDYFRISWVSFRMSAVKRHFLPSGSSFNFWPFFKHEWVASTRGQEAAKNCMRISLYEKIFDSISCQRLGVYIQENQPWEMALIHAWKAAGHGKLVGVPHTSVRFWDLRYFYDHRSYRLADNNILPTPDLVAVNGPVAKNAYLEGGYPETQLAEVEALRFLHLLNGSTKKATIKSHRKALHVLVCGDFLLSTNHKILSWLSIAAKSLPPETSYVFKPHPAAYPVELTDYQSLPLEMTIAPLSELFANCDVVFASSITTAVVDAYFASIPVIQMLDGNAFNMSPLRGMKGVVYVTNPRELAEALRSAQHRECVVAEPYFYLDEELPRWRRLLGLSPAAGK